MENKNIEIISFNKNWDISHIKTSGHKLMILCSDILYTSLLEELLKNNINRNVLFDKKMEYGYVYDDKKKTFINMTITDIIYESVKKLRFSLLEINNILKNYKDNIFETQCIQNEEEINKKFIDFQENPTKRCILLNKLLEIYYNNIDENYNYIFQEKLK